MDKTALKNVRRISREAELESLRQHGPQHGRAGAHRSKKDKFNCPKRQRKNWSKGCE